MIWVWVKTMIRQIPMWFQISFSISGSGEVSAQFRNGDTLTQLVSDLRRSRVLPSKDENMIGGLMTVLNGG